ncbi:hypothetical protein M427DRAFT_264056 [Gonapodya prolifera JEL478]|uniref:Uncharacterized protein n=1 Tax=Gonapodya prolifera (strain JEL478) TaxID=1344416 RepID=A0A139AK31_GONPJ|nr:hypothetical protein M427DRAFT_264056 [Gonapodya prolifera JEL478]|eukprot:KXS17130.1 hypothetical protein M427DRAFT_264056 [Gonapodya prolifera JEL478]
MPITFLQTIATSTNTQNFEQGPMLSGQLESSRNASYKEDNEASASAYTTSQPPEGLTQSQPLRDPTRDIKDFHPEKDLAKQLNNQAAPAATTINSVGVHVDEDQMRRSSSSVQKRPRSPVEQNTTQKSISQTEDRSPKKHG